MDKLNLFEDNLHFCYRSYSTLVMLLAFIPQVLDLGSKDQSIIIFFSTLLFTNNVRTWLALLPSPIYLCYCGAKWRR